ncbi:MAG: hypothetical protein NZ898_04790 [Myxococcota bacterium]|nr:hypothetical protein [Myxococcota bacterium]MDW8361504.1 hypothetical protein [Myxococcales bacterium]
MTAERRGVPRAAWLLLPVAAIGAVVSYDALTQSDEERVRGLLDAMEQGEVDAAWIERLLRWVEPAVVPLEARWQGEQRFFDGTNAAELAPLARRVLGRYRGQRLRALRERIEVDGSSARLWAQLLTPDGIVELTVDLERVDDRWLVTRAVVH